MKKAWWKILLIVIAVLLLIPIRLRYKDGGTVEYKAVLYSVKNYHAIHEEPDGEGGYKMSFLVGTEVKIVGITVFDNTHIVPMEEAD